jgi:glycine oxidase
MNVLIAGQGLAGSVLALELINRGARIMVVDLPQAQHSTRVAAGVVRPITGRHQVKSHKADLVIPFAVDFYRRFETIRGNAFFHQMDVLQLFSSPSVLNSWYGRAADPEYKEYIGEFVGKGSISTAIRAPHGGVMLKQCGYLDTVGFLEAVRDVLKSRNSWENGQVLTEELEFINDAVLWRNSSFDYVIFCGGSAAAGNSMFSFLPFRPVKGEILNFKASDLQLDYIVNNGNYIVPVAPGTFRVGATNSWDETGDDPTEPARQLLETWLKETIQVAYTITGHAAGMRPAVLDRKPLIGFHPNHRQVVIFNGLGSKGVMLAPYFANQLITALDGNGAIDQEVDINRFPKPVQ